ncbi:TonB-linked SusC/RagA family outer membrane protein [Chitinophaga dinghuensis]|uniref:TonB-linked SusC/RagA family outer membrane protein n=1 Tax=Chitinophaga dinghuensis TaxID=1539050 RepID=A0A327VT23_9BACT|nr:SusC/RagA family TonB-linked outer membrane protein [Chitinophaga dinghuensis]RAJ79201.1 TonB-linked SusC/RagA family outer membrane protein [Chitinophaga dinghuensis]
MQQTLSQALRSFTRLSLPSVFLFFVILVFAVADTAAQIVVPKSVTLHYRKASLKTVLRDIERQTKYTFAISSDELENRRGVSIQVKNSPLPTVLPLLFPPAKYSFEIRDGQIIVIPVGSGNPNTPIAGNSRPINPNKWLITGIITDGMQPLSGVSIREDNTQNGTATAEDGTFQVEVASGQATLHVSLIGFQTKEISVRDRRIINVILQPDLKKLNELVVLGYGLQKRANITGAIAQVEGNRLKSRPVPNVIAALQGTATGLVVTRSNGQPGKEGFNLQIRGVNSGSGSNTPVIVDGVPGSLSVLNPDDIESVSILKDAAAAAIYGARGAGGVVLVSTRTGKPGKISVDFNTLGGWETPIRLPQRLSAATDASMENIAAANAGKPAPWQPAEIALLEQGNKYLIDPNHPDFYKYYYNYNQLGLVTKDRTAVQNYNLSVKGGSEKNQFTASMGYFGRQGLFAVGPDRTNRINGRLSMNNRFNKHFSLESRMSLAQSNTFSPSQLVEGPQGLLAGLYRGPGNVPVFVPGTNHYALGAAPVYAILQDGGKRLEKNDYIDAVFTLRADSLVKGLNLRLIYSPQKQILRDDLGRQTIPLWNRVAVAGSVQPDNMLQQNKLESKGGNLQLLGDYDLKINDKNTFHLLGGITQESYNTTQFTAASYNIAATDIASNRFSTAPQDTRLLGITGSLTSLFGKLNYNFDNRYLLEANLIGARLYQAGNYFPSITQWKLFPSFSAGWRLNNETWFYEALPFFNEFKLRWSWGQLGNVNSWNTISSDERYQTFTFHPGPQLQPFVYHNPVPQAYGWENIAASNFGWDAVLVKGQLSLSADYFIRRNRDMQMPKLTSSLTGAWPLSYHEGEMRTEGWEFNAGWKSQASKAFTWYLNANIFHSKNKVLRSDGVSPQAGWNQGVPGYAYSSLFGYQAEGYFQTQQEVNQHAFQNAATGPGDIKYKDINGDHVIDSKDLVYLGTTDPLYSYGIDAGISWKGIELSVFFQGVGNRKVMPDPRYNIPFNSGWQEPWSINQDYWTPNNPNALFPRLYLGDQQNTVPSSQWVMNGAYIRLKNLQLGYTLPAGLLKAFQIKLLRIYFSGQDLWETNNMKIKYYDPEQASGYNGNVYPFFRSYTFGLNVSF